MKKKRILLVDDEVSFTRLLKLNLEQTSNYEVCVENWAEEALNTARNFRPDLVLLDLIMPRMIGSDVAAHFRADANLKQTPILFLSAVGRRAPNERHRVVEEYPCIPKPASVEELIDSIERHLPNGNSTERFKRGQDLESAPCGR